jgi:hypothetical protein
MGVVLSTLIVVTSLFALMFLLGELWDGWLGVKGHKKE